VSDFVRLKYIETAQLTNLAKPVLADRDGEVNTNWVTGGTHSVTADATHVHAGTKSFKLTAGGTGDFDTNFASLASGNNATFVVGKKYCLHIWTYSESAANVRLKTSGVTTGNIVSGAAWSRFSFVFTAAAATTALQIISNTVDAWFELEPIYEYEDFDIVVDKGLRRADKYIMWPQIVNQFADGSSNTQYKAWIRSAILRTVALTDAQLTAYLAWTLDNNRLLDYEIQSVLEYDLIFIPPPEQEILWYDDFTLTPYLDLDMAEGICRTE
jgi:hypothetical protein